MQQKSKSHPLFQPNEILALFGTEANELALSPEGLYYLGVVRHADAQPADTAA